MDPKPCYCINPNCQQPDHPQNNNPNNKFCLRCGSQLLLNSQFRVSRLLSDDSGFGNVYEVFQGFSAGILKVLKPQWNNDAKAIELFKREYEVLAELSQQGVTGIPKVLNFFEYQTRNGLTLYCLVMEKVEGIDLIQWLKNNGKANQKQALKWLREITLILDKIHNKNYFHRDLKPHNIMMRNNGELVLIDFGTAREETQTYLQKMQGNSVTGISTAGYTPREQEYGQSVVQSDFFALGRTFVHLLTGQHPLDLYNNFHDELMWHDHTENISPLVLDFLDELMDRLVKNRPSNTQIILEKLNQLETQLSNNPSISQPPTKQTFQPVVPSNSPPFAIPKFSLLHTLEGHGYWQTEKKWLGLKEEKTFVRRCVNSVVFSPDDQVLASGSDDNTIKLWEVATGKQIKTLRSHSNSVVSVSFSPDSQVLASSSSDKTIKLWDVVTGEEIKTLRGHSNSVVSVSFSPDSQVLASGSNDKTIKLWEVATGKEIKTLSGHSDSVRSVAFSSDGQVLASGSDDKIIKLWEVATGKEINTLSGHSSYVLSVVFSPDSRVLASGGSDNTLKLWEVATGREIKTLSGHSSWVRSVVFSPDGRVLASGSYDKTIKLWKVGD